MSAEPEVSYFASMCPLIDVEVIKEVLTANKHDPNKKSSTHLADLFLQMNADAASKSVPAEKPPSPTPSPAQLSQSAPAAHIQHPPQQQPHQLPQSPHKSPLQQQPQQVPGSPFQQHPHRHPFKHQQLQQPNIGRIRPISPPAPGQGQRQGRGEFGMVAPNFGRGRGPIQGTKRQREDEAGSPAKKARIEDDRTDKDFYFAYGQQVQKINVCIGTPAQDVMFTVGQVFKLKSDEFVFTKDGTACTFGFNYPSGTRFHVTMLSDLAKPEVQENHTLTKFPPTAPPFSPEELATHNSLYPPLGNEYSSSLMTELKYKNSVQDPVEINDGSEENGNTDAIAERGTSQSGEEINITEDREIMEADTEQKEEEEKEEEKKDADSNGFFRGLFGF